MTLEHTMLVNITTEIDKPYARQSRK